MPSLFTEKLDNILVKYLGYFNYKNYVDEINLEGNEKILEVGCGGGNLLRFLAERIPKGKLVCVDNSDYWIDKAEKRLNDYKNIFFRCEDFLDFKKDNYFDVVIVHYVLHDIAEKKKSIGIMERSLKDKGRIFIREPTRKNHGMFPKEIKGLMELARLKEICSKEGYSFPMRGKVYQGIFQKLN